MLERPQGCNSYMHLNLSVSGQLAVSKLRDPALLWVSVQNPALQDIARTQLYRTRFVMFVGSTCRESLA